MAEDFFQKYYNTIDSSNLFDKDWYSKTYLKNNGDDPIRHYIATGWKENCNPSPYFDTKWYLDNNPDVKKDGINPFVHYINYGKKEGRLPNPENRKPKMSTFDEYYQTIEESNLFEKKWYLEKYLNNGDEDPIKHYITKGWKENCNPSPDFDTKWYLEKYDDVKKDGINPFVHYIKYGMKQNRLSKPSSDGNNKTAFQIISESGLFDAEWFAKYYSLEGSNVNLIKYYIDYCEVYGLNPSPDFDSMWYLEKYVDVKKNGINPFVHYILYGKKQGREAK